MVKLQHISAIINCFVVWQVSCSSLTNAWSQVSGRDQLQRLDQRSAGVTPEVNLRTHVTCTPLTSGNQLPTLALKRRGDITRSPKLGYQRPLKMLYITDGCKHELESIYECHMSLAGAMDPSWSLRQEVASLNPLTVMKTCHIFQENSNNNLFHL